MSRNIDRLLEIMALLRDPEKGCPWDVEQDFASIAPHTIEEAFEVADAIERMDMEALEDELGDLLLQVVFHARMAEEDGLFAFDDVVGRIVDKLVRRHPHVFGNVEIKDAETQTKAWEEHKARERAAKAAEGGENVPSALDGVIVALPALTRAYKLQNRAARVGFDWDGPEGALAKVREELDEVAREIEVDAETFQLEAEVGDLLFSCVNLARKLGIEPERALRHGNGKFERRFHRMEALLAGDGLDVGEASLEEMDRRWERAKEEEAPSPSSDR